MNKLLSFFFVLLSFSFAFAGGIGGNAGGTGSFRGREMVVDRNELLRLNRFYNVNMAEVPMQNVKVSVTNLCVGFNSIHTITPVRIETASSSEEKNLSTPRFAPVNTCVAALGKTCTAVKTELQMVQTNFSMDVIDVPRGTSDLKRYMYKVNYTLPPCENVTNP
jgi:hypothetical protein